MDERGFAPLEIAEIHRLRGSNRAAQVQVDFVFVRKDSALLRELQREIETMKVSRKSPLRELTRRAKGSAGRL